MHKELSLENTSFYDLPTIKPNGNDVPSDGPVRDIPGRAVRTRDGMVAIKQQIPGKTKILETPENDPRKWNSGGDGNWFSETDRTVLKGKKPING